MHRSNSSSILVESAARAATAEGELFHPSLRLLDGGCSRGQAAQLYREYGPVIYRRCLRLLREREAARDATQDIFIKLLADVAKLEQPEAGLRWAYRVATNHCLNLLRDSRCRREEPVDLRAELRAGLKSSTYPEVQLAQAILARFDAQTQAIAVGVYVEGMEHEEVASVLGISRRTVSRKLDRFVEDAKKFLSRGDS